MKDLEEFRTRSLELEQLRARARGLEQLQTKVHDLKRLQAEARDLEHLEQLRARTLDLEQSIAALPQSTVVGPIVPVDNTTAEQIKPVQKDIHAAREALATFAYGDGWRNAT